MAFRKLAVALGMAGALVASGWAVAQEAEIAPEPAEPTLESESSLESMAPLEFTDEQLEAFVAAYIEVTEIAMSYEPQLIEATDDDELIALQTQAQQEMIAAVDAIEGISIEDYSLIFQAAQIDPDVSARVQALVEEQMQ